MNGNRRTWYLLVALALSCGAELLAQAQKSPQQAEVLFESARQKELVDGKLQEAIQLYQRIVQEYSANRPLAAKALLQMGQCYEKLGQADARKTYERLVREFGDQAESVAEARARLAALAEPATSRPRAPSVRQVWAAADVGDSVSADGRFLATTDWWTGDIAISDRVTGELRRVTRTGDIMKSSRFGYYAKLSPDEKQIAYAWFEPGNDPKTQRFDLWLVGADGTGARLLYRDEKVAVLFPHCWTPDGKSIVATAFTPKAEKPYQIVLVSAESGAVRVLSSSQGGPSRINVSPDGRFLVYAIAQANKKNDIVVISLQDGRETALVEHPADDSNPIWTPDGHRVLFTSDRTGTVGLWAVEVADGKAIAAPELVRQDMGRISPIRFTNDGTLFYVMRTEVSEVFVSALDPTSGRLSGKPTPVSQQIVAGRSNPSWSPDGRHLAYLTTREPATSGSTITIKNVDSGEEHDIHVEMSPVRQMGWFPDGTALVVPGLDLKRTTTVLRVDIKSGTASTIFQREDLAVSHADVTHDGKLLVYLGVGPSEVQIVIRDLQTGRETTMTQVKAASRIALSPDGRSLAVIASQGTARGAGVVVVPLAGGEPREIYRTEQPNISPRSLNWSAEGNRVLCAYRVEDKAQIVLIPVDGGQPVTLAAPMSGLTAVSLHPDGRRVAIAAGQSRSEVWALENFLPPAKK